MLFASCLMLRKLISFAFDTGSFTLPGRLGQDSSWEMRKMLLRCYFKTIKHVKQWTKHNKTVWFGWIDVNNCAKHFARWIEHAVQRKLCKLIQSCTNFPLSSKPELHTRGRILQAQPPRRTCKLTLTRPLKTTILGNQMWTVSALYGSCDCYYEWSTIAVSGKHDLWIQVHL